MEERRSFMRRQSDRTLLKRLEELAQWRGDAPQSELRQRRRLAIRHHCVANLSLNFQELPQGELWSTEDHPVKGRVLDLSTEGCALFLGEVLDVGQQLSVLITIRSGSKIHTLGFVRWFRPVAKRQGYACGIEFSELTLKDQQLVQVFLKELEETQGL